MRKWILAGVTVYVSLFYRLGDAGLIGPDESSYAQVAREMLESGDWVTPHLMKRPWLEKPPLYYWTAALAMSVLGPNENAARLPSALAALVTCVFLGLVGSRIYGGEAGLRVALLVASSLGVVIYGRAAMPDALFTMGLTIGLGSYVLYSSNRTILRWLAAAYAGFGLAVLAKGPAGLILPALVIVPFEILEGRGVVPRARSAAVALVSLLAVTLPWHWAILNREGWEWIEVFLFQHNVDRFLTTVHRHPGSVYYYIPVLAAVLFPWTLLLPTAAWKARARGPSERFFHLWLLIPFLFFSLAGSKLPSYLMPVLPAAALLMGGRLEDARVLRFQPLLSALGAAAILYAFHRSGFLTLQDAAPLVSALLAAGLVGAALAARGVVVLAATSVVVTLALVHSTAPHLEPFRSMKVLGTDAARLLEEGESVVCYKTFYREALFYTNGRLSEIWTLEELRQKTYERGRILILTERARQAEIAAAEGLRSNLLEEVGTRVLSEVRPAANPLWPLGAASEAASPSGLESLAAQGTGTRPRP